MMTLVRDGRNRFAFGAQHSARRSAIIALQRRERTGPSVPSVPCNRAIPHPAGRYRSHRDELKFSEISRTS